MEKRLFRVGRAEGSLWLWWVLASAVGWILGFMGAFGPVSGVVIGTAQWLILRRRVHRSGWWVLASAVGWSVGLVAVRVGEGRWTVGMGGALVGGIVIGTVQWLILRRRVYRSGWWVLASAVGVLVGLSVGAAAAQAMGGEVSGLGGVLVALFGGAPVGGAIYGAITGVVLAMLLRQPIEQIDQGRDDTDARGS